jgi:hypothetical protein
MDPKNKLQKRGKSPGLTLSTQIKQTDIDKCKHNNRVLELRAKVTIQLS